MEKKVQFQVKIGVKDLYYFLLSYNYKSFGGLFGLLISVVCLVYLAITCKDNSSGANLLFLFLGLLFTVIQPLMLFQKAAQQVTKSPAFREPLEYEVNEEGVVIRQNAEEVPVTWNAIVKVVEDKKQILIYTSRVNACIWPKEQFAEQVEEVKEAISAHMEPNLCKWKKGTKTEDTK